VVSLTLSSVAGSYKCFGRISARIFEISLENEDSTLIRNILRTVYVFSIIVVRVLTLFWLVSIKNI